MILEVFNLPMQSKLWELDSSLQLLPNMQQPQTHGAALNIDKLICSAFAVKWHLAPSLSFMSPNFLFPLIFFTLKILFPYNSLSSCGSGNTSRVLPWLIQHPFAFYQLICELIGRISSEGRNSIRSCSGCVDQNPPSLPPGIVGCAISQNSSTSRSSLV